MSYDLRGKVALVTGSNRGIGAAIVKKLASCGAEVVINYPPQLPGAEEEAKLLLEEVSAMGHMAITVGADVTKLEEVRAMFDKILEELGPVTILVNNAGITRDTIVIRMKQEDWDAVLEVNLTGTHLCCQAAIKQMARKKVPQIAIVNISSLMGITGNAGQANYVASKGGIIAYTKALALELGKRARVNAVAPGFIESDMTANFPEELRKEYIGRIPLGRPGTIGEVANAVAFLASDEASYTTGVTINLDGGWNILP
ncbi:beta-ketoacyl-ACP reductase [Candidatus Berkelbacteria bacterium RBG_13_40_8]|uniref:Beta-ketoacyl-ACP reductase n=1 Tax=Candidatus Berkelbacteria bacterium RBG_13_40_8 TaxID=1797467 RepID=A0A1F5DLW8_9BACT|nr:MAG: beta-ketoacyl-ACP reductase [Candidatus Berkelbacteria bacterium RBG_13_40_8]